jgi:hypothetical protein
MMRRATLRVLLVLALTSVPAFAYEEARLDPDRIRIRVGESADIRVGVHHVSGFNYTMWRFYFSPDRDDLIRLNGTVDYAYPNWGGTMHVQGLAPGMAEIWSGGRRYATVEVTCAHVESVQPLSPSLTAKKGEPVRLGVIASDDPARVLQWYAGRIGDSSHPLAASAVDLEITLKEAGTHYFWVSANSTCSSSSAEFRVDVISPRRRAVGRR